MELLLPGVLLQTATTMGAVAAAAVVGAAVGALAHRAVGDDSSGGVVEQLADRLDVRQEPLAVQRRVTELTESTDELLRAAADAGLVDTSQDRVEALESVASDLSRGQATAAGGSQTGTATSGGDSGEVAAAVERARSGRSVRSPVATSLLSALADERVDRRMVRDAVEDAVDDLETAHAVEQAAERAGNLDSVAGARAFDERLEELDGPLPRALRSASSRLVEALRADGGDEATVDALSELVGAADQQTATTFEGSTAGERGRTLARRVTVGDVRFDDGESAVATAATTVDTRENPDSAAASGLLDALREHDDARTGRLEDVLTTAVGALDEHEAVRQRLADVDERDVTRVANSVKRDLDPGNAVEAALLERVATLTSEVERSTRSDGLVQYAAHAELAFYRDTLVSVLESDRRVVDDASGSPTALRDEVAARIEEVEAYYERRGDHNHTIPRHFVSLARTLFEEAEGRLDAEPERARGALEASEAVLDHVEDLYERNQYSILLRRLRG